MKKLFTLFAFLAVFLGANAIEIVDAEVDFSKYSDISEVKWAGWGASESALARLSIVDGCLHFESTEATDPTWDCQFHPIGFGNNAEVDVVYTLHYKVKGSKAENISALGFGLTPYGQFPITTEWVEGTFDYKAAGTSGDILFQCGGYIGSWDIAYLKITHEGEEEKPVQWSNLLTNGDAEGEYDEVACAYAKEFVAGAESQPAPYPAIIEDLDGNKVFAVHAKEVDPPFLWDSDGEQWGQQHKAGDPMPDNAWQNQFWITLPEGIAAGTQLKVAFKVKASETNLKADIQTHYWPGDYLGGFTPGTIDITTDWTPYEFTFEAPAPNDAHKENNQYFQSIAFNLGVGNQYNRDINFYFDDIELSEMVLEHGFFVASANTETGLTYDFDSATEFVEGEDPDGGACLVATVGTEGDKDSYVNEVMISTVRGNNKAFKSSTIKNISEDGAILGQDTDDWKRYSSASSAKISLPSGVWKIYIAPDDGQILFMQIEGEVKEPVDIVTNDTEITVNGQEREDLKDSWDDNKKELTVREEADNNPDDEHGAGGPGHNGEAWDNQLFIKANRALVKGEVTMLKFKYKASAEAKATTQCHGENPGAYMHWAAIGDVNFTTEWQEFEKEFTIPNEADGMWNIAFNLAEYKGACVYEIKEVQWYLKDETLEAEGKTIENLINATGDSNFYIKEGAGTNPYIPSGIFDVINDATTRTDVIYNLSGQRVSKDYKGVVIMNGRKVVNK